MKKHDVIAEFVDAKTSTRHFPAGAGEEPNTFTPHSDEQAEALVAAGCIREPSAKSAPSPSPALAPAPAPTLTPAVGRNRRGS